MPVRSIWNDEQAEILHAAALRVWGRFKREGKTQKDLAHALGITQQSVSNLIKGTYRPGVRIATDIAILDGKELEDLVGDVPRAAAGPGPGNITAGEHGFPNLDTCIQFHSGVKTWSPWTIAAARAGFYGTADYAAPEWVGKLDHLEKALERARKGT